jgi:hypothetical protein
LETLLKGVFEKRRFLDHQFHAVKAAVDETSRATGKDKTGEAEGTYWAVAKIVMTGSARTI